MESSLLRGFSYMPELKKQPTELELIEEEELNSTWKAIRRQRLKEQETRLWNDFVSEKDIARNAFQDDPYQFLNELPEAKIKELLAIELAVMKKEEVERQEKMQQQRATTDLVLPQHQLPPEQPPAPVVSFQETEEVIELKDEGKEEQDNVLHIIATDDDSSEYRGDSDSAPATVREVPPPPSTASNNASSKSSENISNILESSIYCARIKDLRARLIEEMNAMCTTIDCQNISILDREDIIKTLKRSAEYTSRYNRIHLYNLQRQIEYIKRQNQTSLPFAKYTQFQAQIIRIVSLYQNILQALQVFHRSLSQTHCVPPAGEAAGGALRAARAADQLCAELPAHLHLDDNLLECCDRLETTVREYCAGVTSYLQHAEAEYSARSQKTKKSEKGNRSGRSADPSGRLSMYSETRLSSKHGSARDINNTTSRYRMKIAPKPEPPTQPSPKTTSAKSRRPLMRAPKGQNRLRHSKETEVATMVEICSRLSPVRSQSSPGGSPAPARAARAARAAPSVERPAGGAGGAGGARGERGARGGQLGDLDNVHTAVGEVDADSNCPEKECLETLSCDVTQLVKQLCGGDSQAKRSKDERASGARNAQLVCVKSNSPRSTTPQLLRILEETIQKKSPRAPRTPRPRARLHLPLSVQEDVAARIFQYRRLFVQHMLTSPMYANSSIGRPWDVLSSVSEQLIDEMLNRCAQELELRPVVDEMYNRQTKAT